MKLTYRGVSYEYDPTQARNRASDRRFETVRKPTTLVYRGSSYQLDPDHRVQATYQPRSAYQLTYRGNPYWVHSDGEQPAFSSAPREEKLTQAEERVKAFQAARTTPDLSNVHRANLERNLEHRIQVAREKEDIALLALLEVERRQLV